MLVTELDSGQPESFIEISCPKKGRRRGREGAREREYEVEIFSMQLLMNDYPRTRFESYCKRINN